MWFPVHGRGASIKEDLGMVKNLIVVFSALALIMTVATVEAMPPGFATHGDTIMIPMKVKTTFKKETGPGGFSALFSRGCEQYTAGITPWGTWKAVKCSMKTQVIPPKCVAPAMLGPVGWGAPPAVAPGCQFVKSEEKYAVVSPGCNPCVDGGLQYQYVKKQAVK